MYADFCKAVGQKLSDLPGFQCGKDQETIISKSIGVSYLDKIRIRG